MQQPISKQIIYVLPIVAALVFIGIVCVMATIPTEEEKRIDARVAEDAASHAGERALAKRREHAMTMDEALCQSLQRKAIGEFSVNDLRRARKCRAQGLWSSQ